MTLLGDDQHFLFHLWMVIMFWLIRVYIFIFSVLGAIKKKKGKKRSSDRFFFSCGVIIGVSVNLGLKPMLVYFLLNF